MLEYLLMLLVMLLVMGLVIIAIFSLFKNRIPLRPRIIYGTVGVSFAMGAIFPAAVSTFTTGQVLFIYICLIAFSATALSYIESKFSVNVFTTSEKAAVLESESIPAGPVEDSFPDVLQANIAALEICATTDNTTETEENTLNVTVQTPEEVSPSPVEYMPVVEEEMIVRELTATEDKHDKEALPVEEGLSSGIEVAEENVDFKEEPIVPFDLSESIQSPFEKKEELPVAEEDLFTIPLDTVGEEYLSQNDYTSNERESIDEKLPDQSEIIVTEELDEETPLYVAEEIPVITEELPANAEESLVFVPKEPSAFVPEEPSVSIEELPWKEQYEDMIRDENQPPQYVDTAEAPPDQEAMADEVVGTDYEEPSVPIPDIPVIRTGPVTVDDYISAGFEAKARGNPAGAAEHFFKALHLNPGQQISAALALEISAAYQELGQYLQAGMILKSVMEQEDINLDSFLRQRIQGQLVYLDTLIELLRIAKMPNAPYSRIPNLIKIKANHEAAERLKEITKGGRVSEEQPTDFRATGS